MVFSAPADPHKSSVHAMVSSDLNPEAAVSNISSPPDVNEISCAIPGTSYYTQFKTYAYTVCLIWLAIIVSLSSFNASYWVKYIQGNCVMKYAPDLTIYSILVEYLVLSSLLYSLLASGRLYNVDKISDFYGCNENI